MNNTYMVSFAKKAAFTLFTAAAFVWLPSSVFASSGGITGMSVNGCTCHGSGSPSSATTLGLTSSTGKFEVEPGGTLTLTFEVAHASKSGAGLNISVVDAGETKSGTLTPVNSQEMRVTSKELTHRAAKAFTDGKATFTFTWTAPATPGTYTLRAAGNAVNLNGQSSGDEFNLMTQEITVGTSTSVGDHTVVANTVLHSVEVAPSPVSVSGGTAELRYRLEKPATVTIELFDVNGRPVRPLESVAGDAGEHTVAIDTRQLSNGMYIAILRAGNEQIAKHFAVVR